VFHPQRTRALSLEKKVLQPKETLLRKKTSEKEVWGADLFSRVAKKLLKYWVFSVNAFSKRVGFLF